MEQLFGFSDNCGIMRAGDGEGVSAMAASISSAFGLSLNRKESGLSSSHILTMSSGMSPSSPALMLLLSLSTSKTRLLPVAKATVPVSLLISTFLP